MIQITEILNAAVEKAIYHIPLFILILNRSTMEKLQKVLQDLKVIQVEEDHLAVLLRSSRIIKMKMTKSLKNKQIN